MRCLIVCFFAGWTACLGAAEPAKRPLKVLMIGNSFSQSVMDVTPDIANSMGQPLDIVSMFVGGCTLERHWQNVLAPTSAPYRISWSHNGVRGFKYPAVERALRDSLLPSWNPPHDLIPVKGSNVEDMLKADKWDVVTLQQASHFSAMPESYHPWDENLLKKIRELAPQARILVQQTWAYPSWEKRLAENGGSSEKMFRRVASAYSAFADRHGLEIIPVGAAVRAFGDSDLLFTKPDFHLNLQGKYLQGLVWVATLFHVDVSDCLYLPKWLEPQMAGRLKDCAMKAVREKTSRTFRPALVEGDATKAVQAAIDDCFRAGGGIVRLCKGKWNIGGIRVRSNVTLYLESGCTLVGSRDISRYYILENDVVEPVDPKLISHERWYRSDSVYKDTIWRYPGNRWNNALIRLYKAENAAIVGEPGSLIDGSNPYDPEGEGQYRGPLGINAIDCKNLVFRGYATNNTGNWAHRLVDVDGFSFDGVTCLGGHDSVHFNGCDNVRIENCTFKTGDDCIAGFDNHRVVVRNCYINSSCSAFRFAGNDVLVEKCTIKGPGEWGFRGVLTKEQKVAGAPTPPGSALGRTNMLSFFTYYADGTHPIRDFARRIVVRDCTVENTDRFLHYNYNNEQWQRGVPLTDITFERVTAKGVKLPLCACGARGYDVKLLLTLKDCDIAFADKVGEFIRGSYIGKIVLDNVTVSGVEGDLLLLKEEERPALEVRGLRGVKETIREGAFEVGGI